MRIALVLLLLGFAASAPPSQQPHYEEGWTADEILTPGDTEVQDEDDNKVSVSEQKTKINEALIDDFENEVVKMYTLKTLAEGFKLEQAAEEKIIQAAVETLQEEPSPERTQRLQEVGELLRRDKRAVQVLSSLLGSSSGGTGGGATAGASAGSDSGSILSLVGPLLGSSSGGGGGGGGSVGDGASAAAGSDSGSILGLIGPLLSSSSAGGGGGSADSGQGTSVSASAGSDSGSILNLVLPLITSSSSGGGGGGGSNLGSLLSVSSASKGFGSGGGGSIGGGEPVDVGASGGAGVIGQIKGAKIALVGDKINLLMRAKFALLNKVLTTITNKIAVASLPPSAWNMDLKYPDA